MACERRSAHVLPQDKSTVTFSIRVCTVLPYVMALQPGPDVQPFLVANSVTNKRSTVAPVLAHLKVESVRPERRPASQHPCTSSSFVVLVLLLRLSAPPRPLNRPAKGLLRVVCLMAAYAGVFPCPTEHAAVRSHRIYMCWKLPTLRCGDFANVVLRHHGPARA